MIRVADVIMRFLRDHGVTHVFLVSGGGIMHLTDAAGTCEGLTYICNQNESACVSAAEAYARITGTIGAALVTTGPGSSNALASLPAAYVDSIPIMVISGQVRTDLIADYERQRQNGPQEINIIPMVAPVTKYATTITEPNLILAELEIAHSKAKQGRPGPVWVNVPLDVQAAEVDSFTLLHARADELAAPPPSVSLDQIKAVVDLLNTSDRPLLIGGNGIRLAGAVQRFTRLAERLLAPVLLTIGAMDLLPESHPQYLGRFGPFGQRSANFAVQNADLLLSIGASMNISGIGFSADFAPNARRIMVNVDPSELKKHNYIPDVAITADSGSFIDCLLDELGKRIVGPNPVWQSAVDGWRRRYPAIEATHHRQSAFVNSYLLVDSLSDALGPSDIVITGNSLDAISVHQAFRVRSGQRVFTNVNYGAMGWDLPAAIGASCGADGQRVILVTGDGSIQFNLQELLTISVNALNVIIFVLNNEGYQSIRTTQSNYFEGRLVGSDFGSGIGNPDFRALAEAFRIQYARADGPNDLPAAVGNSLLRPGPTLCELRLDPTQARVPRSSSSRRPDGTLESRPLHDMYPFLSSAEVEENMTLFDQPQRA